MTKNFRGVTAALALGFLAPGCLDGSGDPIKTADNTTSAGGSAGSGGSAAGAAGSGGSASGAAGSASGAAGASSGAGGSGVAGAGGGAGSASGGSGQGGGAPAPKPSAVDLLFVVDNSASMADKQLVLANAAPDLVKRLINPRCVQVQPDGSLVKLPTEEQPSSAEQACPGGSAREFAAIRDLHVGVITSSLGGHGADYCSGPRVDGGPTAPDQDRSNNFTQNDRGRLITRGPRAMGSNAISFPTVQTYNGTGLLALDLDGKSTSPPATDLNAVVQGVRDLVLGADQIGCGYESPLEAWYRFLIDPRPPATIASGAPAADNPLPPPVIEGVDQELLQQRAAFLRPDSLLMIVMLTDEDDCSLVDGQLPAKICDAPEFDASGAPVGCKTELKGWPAGYVEGNFEQRETDPSGAVTGNPFPINHIAAQQKVNNMTFSLSSGTPECQADPYAAGCSTCYMGAQGCVSLSPASDPLAIPDQPNLRCWSQKQRFGADFMYAPRRYTDALRSPTVIDRGGYVVPNPLFATGRSPENVIFTGLVGVPWQYIARDPASPASGPRPTTGDGALDWEQILGDPFNPDPALRHDASDPLLRATPQIRQGTLANGSALSFGEWNPYNGHEWNTDNADLQYSCIFQLVTPRDCSVNPTSCDCATTSGHNPLCEKPSADGSGDGLATTTQYFAKAFPAPRVLQVIKGVGSQGVLGSLCAAREQDSFSDGYGYRPTVEALLSRARERLQ